MFDIVDVLINVFNKRTERLKIAFVFNRQRSSSIEEAEFDSPEVIKSISSALAFDNNEVIEVEMTKDGSWISKLITIAPDLIFNTAEGFWGIGRESFAPVVFEQIRMSYVGSGPYACFLTLDKFLTKQLISAKGIPVPEGVFVSDKSDLDIVISDLSYPVFVKPNFEGSSKGITKKSICNNYEELKQYASECLEQFPDGLIIEKYVPGIDVTVPYVAGLGFNGDGVLDTVEYKGPNGTNNGDWVYDYDLKNVSDEKVSVISPANISSESEEMIKRYVQKIVRILGVCDMARVDFRVTPNGEVYFLEVNPLPSLQPGAGLFAATKRLGLDYNATIKAIVLAALKRLKVSKSAVAKSRSLIKRNPKFGLVFNLKRKNHSDDDYEKEAEFDSESTVNALQQAISANGYEVVKIEADKELAQHIQRNNIDIVFNIAEGSNKHTREAQVPAVCDLLGVEHTGSDASCLAITLNKALTSRLMSMEGVLIPRSKVIDRPTKKIKHDLRFPVIIKPNLEGTSKGIYDDSVVHDDAALLAKANEVVTRFNSPALCEEYIQGREFTVGLLGNPTPQVIGILEIAFKENRTKFPVYSFEAKQLENQFDNEIFKLMCPADIPARLEKKISQFAKKVFKLAGCRDVARIDLRVTPEENIYFIEINPLPGLSPGFSDLTIMAERCGIPYKELIGKILMPSVRRWRKSHL